MVTDANGDKDVSTEEPTISDANAPDFVRIIDAVARGETNRGESGHVSNSNAGNSGEDQVLDLNGLIQQVIEDQSNKDPLPKSCIIRSNNKNKANKVRFDTTVKPACSRRLEDAFSSHSSERPKRQAAPSNLKEASLTKKLRR